MNKHTFLLSGIIFFWAFTDSRLEAQITILQADMPGVGSKAVMAVDTTGSLAPQAASASAQTWNYSTFQNTQTNGYLFVDPASTPYYPFFHSSNLADSLVYAPGFTYFTSTVNSFSVNGYGENLMGFAGGLSLHPAFEQISFPATYGTLDGGFSRADTSAAYNGSPPIDSVRIIVNIHYADTVDAFGSMTTPYGTQNVIRQKHYDITIDSILVHAIGFWTPYQTTVTKDYIYRWYANGLSYYFATMQMNYNNTRDSVVQWFNGTNLGVNNIVDSKYTSVYPNPCKAEITFNCSSPDARQVSIFDMTGRQLAVQEIKNGMLIMNTSAYSAGMYFYRVSDISGNVVDRGKFTVQ